MLTYEERPNYNLIRTNLQSLKKQEINSRSSSIHINNACTLYDAKNSAENNSILMQVPNLQEKHLNLLNNNKNGISKKNPVCGSSFTNSLSNLSQNIVNDNNILAENEANDNSINIDSILTKIYGNYDKANSFAKNINSAKASLFKNISRTPNVITNCEDLKLTGRKRIRSSFDGNYSANQKDLNDSLLKNTSNELFLLQNLLGTNKINNTSNNDNENKDLDNLKLTLNNLDSDIKQNNANNAAKTNKKLNCDKDLINNIRGNLKKPPVTNQTISNNNNNLFNNCINQQKLSNEINNLKNNINDKLFQNSKHEVISKIITHFYRFAKWR